MKVFVALVIFQALFAVKLVPTNFKAKETRELHGGDALYPFVITDVAATEVVTLEIKATSDKDKNVVFENLTITGTPEIIHDALKAKILAPVHEKADIYKVEVKVTTAGNAKTAKLNYKIKTVPDVKTSYAFKKIKPATLETKYVKIEEEDDKKTFEVVPNQPLPEGITLDIKDKHVILKKKVAGELPAGSFHIIDTVTKKRSLDIPLIAKLPKEPLSTTAKIIIGVSGALILIMIAVMTYFYLTNRKAAQNADEGRTPVPLFTNPDIPRQISLPVAPTTNTKTSTLDLRDGNIKPADRL